LQWYVHGVKQSDIDADGAGSHAQALIEGAQRFCRKHPGETWRISGVLAQQAAITLNATDGRRKMQEYPIKPALNMATEIFEALERFRDENP
jgi:hypothetical protein